MIRNCGERVYLDASSVVKRKITATSPLSFPLSLGFSLGLIGSGEGKSVKLKRDICVHIYWNLVEDVVKTENLQPLVFC